ncbi:MAG: DUF2849 domain-containing protein [Sneathiellales bacterium]|nr:DUF2849 domain-containing protein [Sneathiellales bacterium]
MALNVFTASLLKEGLVAYLCQDDSGSFWSTDINKAHAVEAETLPELEAEAQRGERENIIVGPYAIEVEKDEQGIRPTSNREQIRAGGPTFRLPQSASLPSGNADLHAA